MLIWSLFHFPGSKSELYGYPLVPTKLIRSHNVNSAVYVNSLLAMYVISFSPSFPSTVPSPTHRRLNVRHWLRESHWVEEVRLDSIGRLASMRCAPAKTRRAQC